MITGKYIRELREAARLSQTELSSMANISQAHLAKIETEKVNPRLSTVNAVLTILQKTEKKTRCVDIMSRKMLTVRPEDPVKKAISLIKHFGISQLPVMERGKPVGSVSEGTIIKHFDRNLNFVKVGEIMDEPFPVVSEEDSADMARDMLEFRPAVLVSSRGRIVGIITKFDLLGAK